MQNTIYKQLMDSLQLLDQWVITNGINAFIWPLLLLVVVLMILVIRFRAGKKLLLDTQARLQQELEEMTRQNESNEHYLQNLQQDKHQIELLLSRLETRNESLSDDVNRLTIDVQQLERRVDRDSQEKRQLDQQLARSTEMAVSLESKKDEYRDWLNEARQELENKRNQYMQLSEEHTQLKTMLEEKQHQFTDQIDLLNNAKEQMKKDFELLANDILENKGRAFREINKESIQTLLNPIQSEMKGFREKVEHIHSEEIKQRSELKAELLHLQKLNKDITDQAEQLTSALQGQKKVQGNWGELILENVLDSSGLRPGVDYEREVSIKTEDGRQRPDAIIYLPQDKHLIIDAKTSLVAYTRYVNAENDLERESALAEHTRAVSDRINELADRDYYRLPGLNSPEVVIMFIPIESAYVEALKYDDTLYQRAIERNVLVATPITLLTSLNIVRQLWQFEDRNKHTAELASRAEKFYNKLSGFLESMQSVGTQLDKAKDSYEKAVGQLYSGRGNLIKQASEFKELGVSVQKELPAEFVEKANLELGRPETVED